MTEEQRQAYIGGFVRNTAPKAFNSRFGTVPIIVMNTAMVKLLTSDDLRQRLWARADMRSRLGRG
jgi:hypothetical protein